MAHGQWMVGGDGVRWHFDSGALALDFAYTGDWGWGVAAWERLHTPADLTRWLREHVEGAVRPAGQEDLTHALRLREAVAAVAYAFSEDREAPAGAVAALDAFAAEADIPPRLGGATPEGGWAPSRALTVVARDAVAIFGSHAERIRQCAAADCRLVFVDTSRPGRRRWCSMRRCGNRAKMHTRNTRPTTPEQQRST